MSEEELEEEENIEEMDKAEEIGKEEAEKLGKELEEIDKNESDAKTDGKEEDKEEKTDELEIKAPTQFSMTIDKGTLEDLLKPVAFLSDDARVNIDENGVSITVVDTANVCMVSATLKKEGTAMWSSVFADELDEGAIGFDVKEILRFIGSADKESDVLVEYLPGMSRIRVGLGNLRYDLALMSLDVIKKSPKAPEIDLPVRMVLEGKEFRHIVASAEKIGDYIGFRASDLGVTAYSKSETTDMSLNMLKSDMAEYGIDSAEKKDINATYAIEYMTPISKVMANKTEMTMKFGDDYPCSIETTFDYGKGDIKYLLAPRIID